MEFKTEGRGKKYALSRSFQMQKRPHFVFQRNKVFSILLFKISHAEDKDFYLGRDRSKLREHSMTLQYPLYIILRLLSTNFLIRGYRKSV